MADERITDNRILLNKVLEQLNEASAALSMRVKQYEAIDDMLRPQMKTNKDGKVEVVLPIAFSMFDSIRTDLCSLLLTDPLIKYEGVSPEDTVGVALLEKVVQYQVRKNKMTRALDTIISNGLKYNSCAAVVSWRRNITNTGSLLSEGNYLIPIDPYSTLFDPSLSAHKVQDANYFGWHEVVTISKLLELVKIGYFENFKGLSDLVRVGGSNYKWDINRKPPRGVIQNPNNTVDITSLYINIIPSEYGMGTSIMPEKWLVCLLGRETIIKAVPLGMEHNKFPVIVCSPDFDDFAIDAPSRMGMLTGMQLLIDWLFGSHITAATRALKNRLIVDPTAINLKDVNDNDTFIRVRPAAQGRDLRTMVHQLSITDVTQGYYQDIGQTMNVMERVSGIDSTNTGQLRQGGPERLTSKEFVSTLEAAKGRIGRMAQILADQIFPDLGMFCAYNTQKLMSKDVMVKITGRWERELSIVFKGTTSALVSAQSLNIEYDVVSYEGSRSGESSSELWLKILELVSANGLLAQKFDIVKIFTQLIIAMGVKDVESFILQNQSISNQIEDPNGMQEQVNQDGQPMNDGAKGLADINALLGGMQ